MFGFVLSTNYKIYAENFKHANFDDDFISIAGAIGSAFNGISRITFGFIMDKYGY